MIRTASQLHQQAIIAELRAALLLPLPANLLPKTLPDYRPEASLKGVRKPLSNRAPR